MTTHAASEIGKTGSGRLSSMASHNSCVHTLVVDVLTGAELV